MIHTAEPGYQVPCERTIKKRHQMYYNSIRANIEKELTEAKSVALSTDEWSSRVQESYLSIEIQFMNENCTLRRFTLCTEGLKDERPNAENLALSLINTMESWNLREKTEAILHDNARAIQLAGQLTEVPYNLNCAAHTLQLVVQDSLNSVKPYKSVLNKGSDIVSHFSHSNVASSILIQRQEHLNMPKRKLIQRVVTRWDSSLDMAKSLVMNKQPVSLVLNDRDVTKKKVAQSFIMKRREWNCLEEIVKILTPFKITTKLLCSESSPTLSLVRPLLKALKTIHLKAQLKDNLRIKKLKLAAKAAINRRFDLDTPNLTAAHFASFYDPRFKNLDHETPLMRNEIIKAVKERMEALSADSKENNKVNNEKENVSALSFLFPNRKNSHDVISQLNSYINMPQIHHDSNPLEWWKNQKERFPLVFQEAQKFLGIPATSASSERTFSTAGQILRARRSALKSENVNTLIFLAQNSHVET
ncbi:E3 SUMO-protein ligase ZBED1 [Lutzomyia longipalpis]|uniref:E3 SUMO-protein ligase ZBED1 n=1 Tax=Lutzomyia longipalpis TaxID=7200 RepID=UPI002483E522|nr:E3 SUMO-protein ligase ZBED1 [Lutzomyia longipalpis]